MSNRPFIPQQPVISNGNMTMTLTSQVSIIQRLSLMSYSLSWAGTAPVGTATVQVSNDYSEYPDGSVNNAGTWNTLTLSGPAAVSGNTGNGFIDIFDSGAYAVRLVYTPVSGTGVLQVIFNAKVK